MKGPYGSPSAGVRRGGRSTRTAECRPRAFDAFVRFVWCGGAVGLAAGATVTALAAVMPWALANALVTVASTILATELHARFTFGSGRSSLRQQVESAGSAVAAYAVTSTAMVVLHLCVAAPGVLLAQIVYLSASALAGLGRFVVLRLVVFAAGRPKSANAAAAGTAGEFRDREDPFRRGAGRRPARVPHLRRDAPSRPGAARPEPAGDGAAGQDPGAGSGRAAPGSWPAAPSPAGPGPVLVRPRLPSEGRPAPLVLGTAAQDLLFREARTANTLAGEPVTDEQIRAVYDLVKYGPTASDQCPLRITLVRSPEARARLVRHMAEGDRAKTAAAPLVAVLSVDDEFHEELPRPLPHFPPAKDAFPAERPVRERSALLNGALRAAYFIIGLRAAGLAAGPMTGFDPVGVQKEFLDDDHTPLVVVSIGGPGPDARQPRSPRPGVDEVVTTV